MTDKGKKKNLLIYAHYYSPDPASTGQILQELAEGMRDSFNITVICVVPSYNGTVAPEYQTQKFFCENLDAIKVIRLRVPGFNKKNKVSRVKNILAYFVGAMKATTIVGKQDYVFSISQPPILGGLLGVYGKWKKHAKFIYNIQDFNPEQIMAVKYEESRFINGLMMWFDKLSCRKSNLVITVGRDLADTLESRFKNVNVPKCMVINNWINEKQIYPLEDKNEKIVAFKKKYGIEDKFVIMYSGNLGLYYDLEGLIRVMKRFRKGHTIDGIYEEGWRSADGKEVVFVFVGEGAVQDRLKDYSVRHHFENIVFIPYQDKEQLIYSLNAADVHWCINAKGIKGVSCPSKAYGIMAVAKPIIGVLEEGSEIHCLIDEIGCGKCCEPGDYANIEGVLRWFIMNSNEIREMGVLGRKYLEENLAKDMSIGKYIRAIKML
nr:glycosyltransferase family 4 protein [uncultured Acetatifactor sp.]